MTKLAWDETGERTYENGVDHGVLYLRDADGNYVEGFVWNGLTTVTESPSGAESNKQYADNMVYVNIKSAEEFGATIEAFTYPKEFGRCDGTASPEPGIYIGQQTRETFGFSYRTLKGNDLTDNAGYKIHLVYGADAAPTEKAYTTVNESPEAAAFSWEVTTIPHAVGEVNGKQYKPTAHLIIDSNEVEAGLLADLEDLIYGTMADDARLPFPAEIFALVGGTVVDVNLNTYANQPSYSSVTHVVTLPAVTGVQWEVNGEDVASGAQPALAVGETAEVQAKPTTNAYNLVGDDQWSYDY